LVYQLSEETVGV